MPVGFWNDPDGSRYHAAYFEFYPGVWRFGDWVMFTERGSAIITGRSDATLNRGGVRLGTSELYSIVEEHDEVLDSLVVHLEQHGRAAAVRRAAAGRRARRRAGGAMKAALRTALSPRHAPDAIVAVPAIPRTMTGKKLELPVKRSSRDPPSRRSPAATRWSTRSAIEAFAAYAAARAGG